MTRTRITHLAIAAVAVVMLLAAGAATASNMAFKINVTVPRPVTAGVVGNQCNLCDFWLSLPYGNPFAGKNLHDLCDSNGDGAVVNTVDQIQTVSQQGSYVGTPRVLNPANLDSIALRVCTNPATFGDNPPYQPNRAVRIRLKTVAAINQVLNIIYVGQDIPGTQLLVRNSAARAGVAGGGSCPQTLCDNWLPLSYHTIHANLRGLCDTDGSGGSPTSADRMQIVRMQGTATNPLAVDSVVFNLCTSPVGANPVVEIGKAVQVRLKDSALSGGVPIPDTLISVPHF
jgi:hypothetical protein